MFSINLPSSDADLAPREVLAIGMFFCALGVDDPSFEVDFGAAVRIFLDGVCSSSRCSVGISSSTFSSSALTGTFSDSSVCCPRFFEAPGPRGGGLNLFGATTLRRGLVTMKKV